MNNTLNEEAAILHSNPCIIITFSVAIDSAVDSSRLAYFCKFLQRVTSQSGFEMNQSKLSRKPINFTVRQNIELKRKMIIR